MLEHRVCSSLTLCLALAVSLVGCTKTKPAAEEPKAAEAKIVNLFIWGDYTSKPLLEEFTKRTGIKVQESNYTSNEELLAKLQAGAQGFDVAVPSDYMVAIMIKLGLLREIDKAQIPNAANLDANFLKKPYDPDNKFSLPYAWSITGIAVNRTAYQEPVTSWADLLANDRVQGRASMLDDMREAIGAALKLNGSSLNSTKPEELAKAKTTLLTAKKGIKAFNSMPAPLLTAGDVVIAQMFSGEASVANRDSGKKIEFIVPKEGATMAIDNAVILKDAPHSAEAHQLINFFYDMATDVDFVTRTLSGPVLAGIKDKLPPEVQANPNLFPSADALARCEMMQDLGPVTADYDRIWSELKAASH